MSNRSNVVIFPQELERLLGILREGKSPTQEVRNMITSLEDRSSCDELSDARRTAVTDGLDENDFDGDDRPAVSAAAPEDDASGGAYVQLWRWVPDWKLPDAIQEKFNLNND